MCLMWLGSLPSGEDSVVVFRYQVQDLMFGPGHSYEFMAGIAYVTLAVIHNYDRYNPDSDIVHVGWGTCTASLSPWSCPFLPEMYSAAEARNIFQF